ncbi:sulfurtransferase [Thermocoleostomius sinensis]|uniref:Sulfurtransferase n=1 Tax=Thermocoleostomius sinensis A174 TaxID=2016057 RepID=A0A9E8ZGN0_9CYAN|nr:sulfurtransferase [Thermocoleostomius sinensis A174]
MELDGTLFSSAMARGECYIVPVAWLHNNLSDPRLVVIDCRFNLAAPQQGRQQYETGHIPGAYFLDLNQDLSGPVHQHGGRHPLPDPNELAKKLSCFGIYSGNGQEPSWVVVYDDSRFAFASRLWWLLRYMGHDHVAVLDGGLSAWQQAGYALSTVIPPWRSGHFVPRLRLDRVVDIETVRQRKDLPSVVLIDSREGERYRGEWEPIDPIAGHIPGALNYPWQDVTDAQGYARSVLEQQQRWATLPQHEERIVYCGSGVTACVNVLSLEMAGISHSQLYVGSWSDWCSYRSES